MFGILNFKSARKSFIQPRNNIRTSKRKTQIHLFAIGPLTFVPHDLLGAITYSYTRLSKMLFWPVGQPVFWLVG